MPFFFWIFLIEASAHCFVVVLHASFLHDAAMPSYMVTCAAICSSTERPTGAEAVTGSATHSDAATPSATRAMGETVACSSLPAEAAGRTVAARVDPDAVPGTRTLRRARTTPVRGTVVMADI